MSGGPGESSAPSAAHAHTGDVEDVPGMSKRKRILLELEVPARPPARAPPPRRHILIRPTGRAGIQQTLCQR